MSADAAGQGHHPKATVAALTLGALGVVYGDIGTSPLYTLRECTVGHGLELSSPNVLGVLSLIFWSLMMVVTVKYLIFIMRADNQGEGGILALLALIPEKLRTAGPGRVAFVAALVIFGAALLYGDGMITPAISVLSAMEGLKVATPTRDLQPFILPLTCAVLIGLFFLQARGTGGIGKVFGPIMVVWFGTIATLGLIQIVKHPGVLAAVSPHHGVNFMIDHKWSGFRLLGSVVLAVTGGEALYADMGHFGLSPIRRAWIFLVLPALCLAYFGQGALILSTPEAAENPFFKLVPAGIATYALIALATCATVIASQALISGAFSLTHQAVQLGFFPRVSIRHTSHETQGQIYIPEINWALAVACLTLVLTFQDSTRMAAAYGIAVCGTMTITSLVFFVVARRSWHWPLWKAGALLALFLMFDLPFTGANLLKFMDGGWVPLALGAGIFLMMIVWNVGRTVLAEYVSKHSPPWDAFLTRIDSDFGMRTAGNAVFMAARADGVPPTLLHHAERIKVLPSTVVVLTVSFDRTPTVAEKDRLQEASEIGSGFYRVVARYGFMEFPDAPEVLALAARKLGLSAGSFDPRETTYYLGRETFLATRSGRLGPWTEGFFGFLSRNARPATAYFRIPPEQVVELGTQIDL